MMKKTTLMVAALIAAGSVGAGEYISPVTGQPFREGGKFTLEQVKARDERVLRKTGGFVTQPAEGPLALLADARGGGRLTLDEVARLYRLGTHLDVDVLKEGRGETPPLAYARRLVADRKPLLAVVVVDSCRDLPALSVFPEERVGIVNADALAGGDDPSAVETRVAKEAWRAVGFVGGVGFSAQDNDVMQPYYTLAELDANAHPYIQPMNMAKMQAMWRRFGVRKARRVPYSVAVQEGWAPEPTNEYQRAVWDRVRRIPTEPMKIEFDPKKGR